MADFLDEKRKEIQSRLNELKPYVDEYQLLQAADQALSGISNGTTSKPAAAGSAPPPGPPPGGPRAAPPPARRAGRSSGGSGGGRRGRPKGGGTRAAQALDLVRSRPGITIPELAEAMGIQQNYLYRVLPGLAEEGKVTKSGRGWHLRDGGA